MRFPFFSRQGSGQLGIDCGGSSGPALACLARPQTDGVTLLSSGSRSWDGDDPGMVLHTLLRDHAALKTPAVAVMPLESYSLLQVEAPEVPQEEMGQAIRWKVKDLIDYPLEEAVIDVFPAPQPPARGKTIYAVSAHVDAVQSQVELLHRSKGKLQALDIPELALRNLASLTPEASGGVGLFYLGRTSGLIVIVHEQTLYVARTIKHGTSEMAESVESDREGDLLDKQEDIQLLLDRVVLDVQRTLDYYESHYGKASINTVLVAPTQDTVPGLMEHLEGNLGTAVKAFDVNGLFKGPDLEPVEQASCFLALGAALRTGGDAG